MTTCYHISSTLERLDPAEHYMDGRPCPCEPDYLEVCGECPDDETTCQKCNGELSFPCDPDAVAEEGMIVEHKALLRPRPTKSHDTDAM